jgi:hypothetical protein
MTTKKNGRPTKIDTINLEEVEKYGGLGFTDEETAYMLGICRATLKSYKKNNEEFLAALKRGKDLADSNVLRALYKKATGGDTTAMIFWLKNRRKSQWNERSTISIEDGLNQMFESFEKLGKDVQS